MTLRAHLTRTLASLTLLLFAAPAFAGTMYFGEVLTASEMSLASNVRATLDAAVVSSSLDILLNGDVTAGAGLGSGYLSGTGDFITYAHQFSPVAAWESVTSATLIIGALDDEWFDGREKIRIELNDDFWQSGSATFNLFHGDVTAYFSNNETELQVAVISRRGDSLVPFSAMIWEYETAAGPSTGTGDPGNGARPVPEPTALALFGIGLIVVRQASRRRS